MPQIDLPPGDGEPISRMWSLAPHLGAAARAFSDAVQDGVGMPIRELEAARMRIAHINGCIPCSEARIEDAAGLGIDETFYADVDDAAKRGRYSPREALAIGFAERFTQGREAYDEAFWDAMRAHFSPTEIVELTVACAKWMGLGRINAVLGLEVACPIVIPRPRQAMPAE